MAGLEGEGSVGASREDVSLGRSVSQHRGASKKKMRLRREKYLTVGHSLGEIKHTLTRNRVVSKQSRGVRSRALTRRRDKARSARSNPDIALCTRGTSAEKTSTSSNRTMSRGPGLERAGAFYFR